MSNNIVIAISIIAFCLFILCLVYAYNLYKMNHNLFVQLNNQSQNNPFLDPINDLKQKISDLFFNIEKFNNILSDKRSRGAFGEHQLEKIMANLLTTKNYQMQYTLKNNTRADCIIFLPEPNKNIIVDAKFPLENFQNMHSPENSAAEKILYKKSFSQDIKKHIKDISEKYIIPNETADSAIMFIPAESIFSEIHNEFPELIDFSMQKKVWLASPTTLMAILTTANSTIKQSETGKHIRLIQERIADLAKDFTRFEQRINSAEKNVQKVVKEIEDLHLSASKIINTFNKIENIELG